jgi:hypothetical protein
MARKKKDETNNENLENRNDSDDTFGLPEIEYKPLDREEEAAAPVNEEQPAEVSQPESPRYEYEQKSSAQTPEYTYEPEEEGSPAWPKILGILIVIALALGAVWYFVIKPRQEESARLEKERIEREAREKDESERQAALQRERDEAERRRADSLANVPKVGTIEVLSERTRRYYVVVASAVDDDLLMDYAKKLSTQGVSSKIIPPFAKYKLYRLTISDTDTFASAQETADAKKAEYGDALWVLKY